jgi:hypothetical protein
MTNPNNDIRANGDSRVHAIVMQRVQTIHFLQSPVTTIVFTAILFILASWGIGREVWVAHVIQNMPSLSDFDAVLRFYVAAFLNTRFIVRALSIIAMGALIWLVVNLARLATDVIKFA